MLWNFSEWMNRLGLQRQSQPELIYGVQPVVVMGDQSALVSPVLPPMAWTGARHNGVVALFTAFTLTSRAAGGTFVRQLWLSGGSSLMRFRINTTPTAQANAGTVEKFDLTPDPTVSVVELGTIAVVPATLTVPAVDVVANGSTFMPEAFYIQPGSSLQMWQSSADNELTVAILFEDLPATIPRA